VRPRELRSARVRDVQKSAVWERESALQITPNLMPPSACLPPIFYAIPIGPYIWREALGRVDQVFAASEALKPPSTRPGTPFYAGDATSANRSRLIEL